MKRLIIALMLLIAGAGYACAQTSDDVLVETKDFINAQCPMVFGNGVTMQNISYDGQVFTYNFKVDESKIKMSSVKRSLSTTAENIKSTLSLDNSVSRDFVQECIDRKVRIVYVYTGSRRGEKCSIVYNPAIKTCSIITD